jgi:hypothetical protein
VRRLIETLGFVAAVAAIAACAGAMACGGAPPSIAITEIPPAAMGGSIRTAPIAGRAEGARSGDRIVLFAKSGQWYVQPLRTRPFTTIDAQGRWSNTIHLGTEYAAILVRDGYRPPTSTKTLPGLGAGVLAIATVNGGGSNGDATAPARPLQFSGYEWDVRQRRSDRGGANEYSAANATVDADGALHLTLTRRDGLWTSAGVCLTRPLGYGTYVFIVRDMADVDPAARLTLFTFDEARRVEHFREMNIDLWRGDTPGALGGQFVVQPNYLPGNVYRFSVPRGRVSHTMRWEPGAAAFKSMRGDFLEEPGEMIASQTFTTGVPGPGDERVCMAYYYYRKSAREPSAGSTIAIERFQYLP